MKPLLIISLLMVCMISMGQKTFRVDSLARHGNNLELYYKCNDSVYCYNYKVWGIGKLRVKRGDVGTIVMYRNKFRLTFKK